MFFVIMAGGSGTRFWPVSRRARPKQFLKIAGDRVMLRQAVDNAVGDGATLEKVLIVAGEHHRQQVTAALPGLPAGNLLCEPVGRNTAPAIAYACLHIARRDPEALVAVLPSDHVILDTSLFRETLAAAGQAAMDGGIVTIGIEPERPETGFGYIRTGEHLAGKAGHEVYRVAAFVEKPNLEVARRYLAEGGYFWNAGMFVFRADVMLAALEAHMPELLAGMAPLAAVVGTEAEDDLLREIYPTLPSDSIDYGVMEKASDVKMVPGMFGWSDVGSWPALADVLDADDRGNISRGDALLQDCRGVIVEARGGRRVVLVGCSDMVVVDTEDALLVVPRDRAQDIKGVLDALVGEGREDLL